MADIGTVEVWATIRPTDGGPDLHIKYNERHVGAEWQESHLQRDIAHCLKFANEVVEVKIIKKPKET